MKKVLYLHGLESKQGGPKVDFLANEFIVHAPAMDYKNPNLSQQMDQIMEDFDPDLIIGSSMGGYVADILSTKYGKSAILFNPALHNWSLVPPIDYPVEGEQAESQKDKIVILGKEDDVIPSDITKLLLEGKDNYHIFFKEMAHQTPLHIFIDVISNYKNEL